MAASKPPSLTTLQNRAARAVLELIARAQTNKPVKLEIEVPLVDDRIAVVAGTVTVRGGIGAAPPPPPPPVGTPARITTQPRGASTVPGATVTITAEFSGTAPLTVQWLRNDVLLGSPVIASGNTASITSPALTLGDNGVVYKLRVANSFGTATSDGAVLQVQDTAMPAGVFIARRFVDPFRLIQIEGGWTSSRYERNDRTVEWTGASGTKTVAVRGYNMGSGGAEIALTGATYTLTIDGVPHSTVTRGSAATVTFSVDLTTVAEGWHWLDVIPGAGNAGETCYLQPIYRRVGASPAAQTLMPIRTHTQELEYETTGPSQDNYWGNNIPPNEKKKSLFYGMVPARLQPTTNPLKPRDHPAFSATLSTNDLVCENLVPCRQNDIHRPTVLADGLMTTAGTQNYHYADFITKYPKWPLHDGPRGKGNVSGAMHLMWGRDGKLYGVDSWRLFRVETTGEVHTLVGYRHPDSGARNWLDINPDNATNNNFELVGDWSAIPPERRGLHEAWGFVWHPATVLENTAAAPIPEQHNERPHIVGSWFNGPVGYIADTQNNRILKVEFNGFDRAVPAKVTEFVTGIGDPWDIAYHQGLIYVSERTSHRIAAYDAITGVLQRVVVQGAALAYVDANRKPRPTASLATIRAEACVAPEGIFIRGNLLYFGSLTMQQFRVVDLANNDAIVRRQDIVTDGNSFYVKLCVGDGTFGPDGAVFVVTWSADRYSYPRIYLADDSQWFVMGGSGGSPWHRLWGDGGYPTAVAVGQGRMAISTVNEGLFKVSKRLPTDQARPANAAAGALKYWQAGHRYLHGLNGWGFYGLPLPWGEDPDIDAHLRYCDHTPPQV
jgi:hypothetical protein